MDVRIPPLRIKIVLESNPLKSTMLVGRLAAAITMILDTTTKTQTHEAGIGQVIMILIISILNIM